MAERFAGDMRIRAPAAGVPPLTSFTVGLPGGDTPYRPFDKSALTAIRPAVASAPVEQANRENVRKMWEYQKATDTACFFASLYGLSAALRPEVKLPDADCYLAEIRPIYGGENGVLDPEKLLVPNNRLAQALRIYEEKEWGMRVTRITRNEKARQLLEDSLMEFQNQGLITDTHSSSFINIEQFTPPFVVWMHEGITNHAHFATIDGTDEARDMVKDYIENKKYFVKMVIEAGILEEPTS